MPKARGRGSDDPLVPLPVKIRQSRLAQIDRAAGAWKVTRTAIVERLLEDGFKWWAREDLERDTTLGMVVQTHERVATVLAMQNALAEVLGVRDDPRFRDEVMRAKRRFLGTGTEHEGDGDGDGGAVDGGGMDDDGGGPGGGAR